MGPPRQFPGTAVFGDLRTRLTKADEERCRLTAILTDRGEKGQNLSGSADGFGGSGGRHPPLQPSRFSRAVLAAEPGAMAAWGHQGRGGGQGEGLGGAPWVGAAQTDLEDLSGAFAGLPRRHPRRHQPRPGPPASLPGPARSSPGQSLPGSNPRPVPVQPARLSGSFCPARARLCFGFV